jgi:hypothetical protein
VSPPFPPQIKESGLVVARPRSIKSLMGRPQGKNHPRARGDDPFPVAGKMKRGTLYLDKGLVRQGGAGAGKPQGRKKKMLKLKL